MQARILAGLALIILTCAWTFVECFIKAQFSYFMVACGGVALFCLGIIILTVYHMQWMNTFHAFLYNILSTGEVFAYVASPVMMIIAVAISISNIWLLRKEGFRLQNMLGIALGAVWILALWLLNMLYYAAYEWQNETFQRVRIGICFMLSFVTCMTRLVPYVIVMIAIAWVLLQVFFPFKSDKIELKIEVKQRQKTWKDYVAWITFFVTILLWVTESLTGINSNVVALIPLAVYTATGVFEKSDIKEINWSVLWLVAGGFALGTGLNKTGLAATLINAIPFSTMNVVVVMIIAGLICYLLSNFISNSATAALLVPILVVVGTAMADPTASNNAQFMALGGMNAMIPFIAVCASIAMLLPISTPPNAIAASTGLVQTKDMSKVGIIIGTIGFVLGYFLLTAIFPFPQA